MSNDYFSFKQFTVHQDRCAMKVGTDGTLLGAWAKGGDRILDVGTGTGLIALMLAQRFPQAMVDAIDIDSDSCLQAHENVVASPFADRVNVHHCRLQDFTPVIPKEKWTDNESSLACLIPMVNSRLSFHSIAAAVLKRRLLWLDSTLQGFVPLRPHLEKLLDAIFWPSANIQK